MNFCCECGQRLDSSTPSGAGAQQCPRCGKYPYRGPRVLVALFAYQDDRLLLHKRAHDPGKEQWTVPSGFVEMNETPEQAVIREACEETGIVVRPEQLHPYFNVGFATINEVHIVFRAQLDPDTQPVAGAESLEVALLTHAEIGALPLAFRETVGDYTGSFFEHLRENRFPFMTLRVTGSRDRPSVDLTTYALER